MRACNNSPQASNGLRSTSFSNRSRIFRWVANETVSRKFSKKFRFVVFDYKKLRSHEKVFFDFKEIIEFYHRSMCRLESGLYLSYLKVQNTVDSIRVLVSRSMPGCLPSVKIRSVSNVTKFVVWYRTKRFHRFSFVSEENGNGYISSSKKINSTLNATARTCSKLSFGKQRKNFSRLSVNSVTNYTVSSKELIFSCHSIVKICPKVNYRRVDFMTVKWSRFEMIFPWSFFFRTLTKWTSSQLLRMNTRHHSCFCRLMFLKSVRLYRFDKTLNRESLFVLF